MSRNSKKKLQSKRAVATGRDESPAAPAAVRKVAGISALLVVLVFLVFGKTTGYDFVNFDDNQYVYDNPIISRGLGMDGIGWAFTHVHSNNWHPLTTIFHMLDCQLYGLRPWGHHLTNLLLHAAAAVLLFLMLLEMTGALWRCAFVAAVFAIHPLRVESVAWVSELKDVLSGVFFMLTLRAYARYARGQESRGRYAMVMLWFALGLLSKPMLVTVPFVLLLLDYWPLGRLKDRSQFPRLVKEKLPLLALSALSCVATVIAQKEAIRPLERLSFLARVANALVACCVYLGKMIYPADMAVWYPFLKNGWPAWQVTGATVLLGALTAWAFVSRRKQPFLVVGWLWYLGMLVPVIGILQVGSQAYADRYTYLPQIGLCIAGTWAVAELAGSWRHGRAALGATAAVVLSVLAAAAFHQTSWWRDSTALWIHALACTQDNSVAHNNLGIVYSQQGRVEDAIAQCSAAVQITPDYADARNNLGLALLQQRRIEEAIAQYNAALHINPAFVKAHNNLGIALCREGKTDEGMAQFRVALQIDPTYADACNNLGFTLFQLGRTEEAITRYDAALQINPGNALAHYNLGNALLKQGRTEEAIGHAQKALEIQPDDIRFENNLAWMLATAPQASLRNGSRALELAMKANQASGGNNPDFLATLAAACAETGEFADALEVAKKALELAKARSDTTAAEALDRQIKLYEAGRPYHSEP